MATDANEAGSVFPDGFRGGLEASMALRDAEVTVGNYVSIAPDVQIGPNVRVGNNVTLYPGVTIGGGCVIFDGAVIGRPPRSTGNTTRPIDPSCRTVSVGAGCVIGANAVLYTGITIGEQVLIGDLATLREDCVLEDQVVIGRGVLVMYNTSVGARTRVIDGAILTGNMTVESDVFIGPGVGTVNDDDVYLKRFGLVPFEARGPIIRRFALIGTGADIAAGVEIGVGAIVSPHAMVTRDVPAWTVVAGIPARIVRAVDAVARDQILAHFGINDPVALGSHS